MSQNKMPPDKYSQMINHLTRKKIKDPFIPDSAIERPKRILEIEAFKDFNKRNPQADGGRIPFAKAKSVQQLGPRDKIDQLGVGKKILKEYSEGAGTIELGKKYGVSRDTINRYFPSADGIKPAPPRPGISILPVDNAVQLFVSTS